MASVEQSLYIATSLAGVAGRHITSRCSIFVTGISEVDQFPPIFISHFHSSHYLGIFYFCITISPCQIWTAPLERQSQYSEAFVLSSITILILWLFVNYSIGFSISLGSLSTSSCMSIYGLFSLSLWLATLSLRVMISSSMHCHWNA